MKWRSFGNILLTDTTESNIPTATGRGNTDTFLLPIQGFEFPGDPVNIIIHIIFIFEEVGVVHNFSQLHHDIRKGTERHLPIVCVHPAWRRGRGGGGGGTQHWRKRENDVIEKKECALTLAPFWIISHTQFFATWRAGHARCIPVFRVNRSVHLLSHGAIGRGEVHNAAD